MTEPIRIVFTQRLNSLWRTKLEGLRAEFPGVELVEASEKASGEAPGKTPREAPGRAPGADPVDLTTADILVGGAISAETVETAERLQLVVVPFTGVNSLPLEVLRRRGIRVANSRGNARSVAERAVALLLAFLGRECDFDADLRAGRWHGFATGESVKKSWESLDGKRAAILGTGAIGIETAGLLRAFGVTATGFRRSGGRSGGHAGEPSGGDAGGDGAGIFDRVVTSVPAAVEGADIVVVALPATPATEGLLDAEALAAMQSAVLVNVGRGTIVEEEALYCALKEGTLRGACIDTWYRYPGDDPASDAAAPGTAARNSAAEGTAAGHGFTPPSRFPFHELDNVVMSPHVGGYTRRAVERSVEEAVENLRRFLASGELLNEVDLTAGY